MAIKRDGWPEMISHFNPAPLKLIPLDTGGIRYNWNELLCNLFPKAGMIICHFLAMFFIRHIVCIVCINGHI